MVWWLIAGLFVAAFVVLEIKLSKSSNKSLGLIIPAVFALVSAFIIIPLLKNIPFLGIGINIGITFGIFAIVFMLIYFYCRFISKE